MNSYIDLLLLHLKSRRPNTWFMDGFPELALLSKLQGYYAAVGLRGMYCSASKVWPVSFWSDYDTVSVDKLTQEAKDFARRIDELCFIVVGKRLTHREILQERERYLLLLLLDDPIRQLKYATNLAFTRHYKLEDPPREGDLLGLDIFPKPLKCWIQRAKGRKTWYRLDVQQKLYTIFQGFKKGLCPIRPHLVERNLLKHRDNLSTYRGELDNGLWERMTELMDNCPYRFNNKAPRDLSRKATFEYSYANGGSLAFARDLFHNMVVKQESVSISKYPPIRSDLLIGFVRKGPEVRPVYSCFEEKRDLLDEMIRLFNFPTESEFRENVKFPYFENKAIPAVILEPMKARIITKPSVGIYSLFTGIQKDLHSEMRNQDEFRLIGTPLTREILWSVLQDYETNSFYVSGDYEAATDNLKMEVTKAIVKGLNYKLWMENPRLADKIEKTLYGCQIHHALSVLPNYGDSYSYNYSKLKQCAPIDQQNGQLMGHNLSFLVLCLANYLGFHISCERYYGKKFKWFELPRHVLINGDDILFNSPDQRFYNIWCDVTTALGFKKSQGKNLCSDKIVQINSELYYLQRFHSAELQETEEIGCYLFTRTLIDAIKINYCNFGLATNRRKQDCSQDYSVVSRTGLQNIIDDSETANPFINRLLSLSKIYESYMVLSSTDRERIRKMKENMETLFRSHSFSRFMPELEQLEISLVSDKVREIVRSDLDGNDRLVLQLYPEIPETKLIESSFLYVDKLQRELRRNLYSPSREPINQTWVRGC